MDTLLTFTPEQATIVEILVAVAFFAGIGVNQVCLAIFRAVFTAPYLPELADPEPEVIVVEKIRRHAPRLPARQRFASPLPAVSPDQWARQTWGDPSRVRLAVTIGAGA